ncbi:MAG: hypothetical protein ACRDQA_30660 [Nocardioidaceae bacterium]
MSVHTTITCDECGGTLATPIADRWAARLNAVVENRWNCCEDCDLCPTCRAAARVQRGYDEGIEYAKGMEE